MGNGQKTKGPKRAKRERTFQPVTQTLAGSFRSSDVDLLVRGLKGSKGSELGGPNAAVLDLCCTSLFPGKEANAAKDRHGNEKREYIEASGVHNQRSLCKYESGKNTSEWSKQESSTCRTHKETTLSLDSRRVFVDMGIKVEITPIISR